MPDKYFQSYEEYFWQWEDNTDVLAIPGGNTIAYVESLNEMFDGLKDQGLPPFGTLLLALVALNSTAVDDIAQVKWIMDSHGDLGNENLSDALVFLSLLSKVPTTYKSGKRKVVLLRAIFENCHNIKSHKNSSKYVKVWMDHNMSLESVKLTNSALKRDFKPLDLLSRKFKTVEDILAKISALPEVEEVVIDAAKEKQSEDLIEQLKDNYKTSKVGSLVKTLWAGLNIPMHSAIKSDQALGGVADLTNKGDYDQLLISEYANDDIVFLSRLANNEALYYSKESPPVSNDLKRIILIDVSLKNWGSPKIVAYAITTAIAQMPKSNVECEIYVIGENVHEVNLGSVEGVIDALQIVEPCLTFSVGLARYFKTESENNSNKTERFIITEKSTLQEPEVSKVLSEYTEQINYLITNSTSGEVDIYRNLKNGRKHHQHLELDLKKHWESKEKVVVVEKKSPEINRKYYPILIPQHLRGIALRSANNGEVFQLTKERTILRHKNKELDPSAIGWEVFYEGLQPSIRDFDIGVLPNGEYVLLTHVVQKKEIWLLNLTTQVEIRVDFGQWWKYKEEVFAFENRSFFYGNDQTTWRIDQEGKVLPPSDNKSYLLQNKRTENSRLVNKYKNSGTILKNIKHVGLSSNTELIFNNHKLTLNTPNGTDQIILSSDRVSPNEIVYAEKISASEFEFKDGSKVEINKNGIIILKSSDKAIPHVYVPTVLQTPLGLATKAKFAGNKYYKNSPSYDIRLIDSGTSKLAVVKLIKVITKFGLKESREKVDNTPSNLCVNLGVKEANKVLKNLEEYGAKAEIVSQNNSFMNDLETISIAAFYRGYVNRFINNITVYGTNS